MEQKNYVIAIDGVAGAGKSTVATAVAKRLKFNKLNTGDIYRAVTLKYLNLHIEIKTDADAKKFVKLLNIEIKFNKLGEQHTFLDGVDVTNLLHNFEVSDTVSKISGFKDLREYVTKIQRQIAKSGNIVVEGRDIGSHVLPNANYKIFLTASVEVRAKRQFEELVAAGDKNVTLEALQKSIIERDYNDTHRKYGAIKVSDGAKVIDTSNLSVRQVVNQIIKFIKEN